MRAGQALPRDRLADRRRPPLERSPPCRPGGRSAKAPRGRRHPAVPDHSVADPCSTCTTWAGSTGSAEASVAVTTVWPAAAIRSPSDAPAAGVELREHVVEQQERPNGQQLRLGEEQREHREPLLALRAETGADRGRRSSTSTSSRCGPEPRRAALEIRLQPRLELLDRRRLGVVAEQPRRPVRARRRARQSRGPSAASASRRAADERSARARRHAPSRRSSALAVGVAELHAPQRQRSAAPARRGSPAAGPARGGQRRPSTRSKYARRAAGPPLTTVRRSGVNTSVAISRRSELRRREARAVQLGALRLARRAGAPGRRSTTPARVPLDPDRGAAGVPNRISCASLRVRGEKPCVPTCSDSSRFVLPAPFRPTTRTTPGARSRSAVAYER